MCQQQIHIFIRPFSSGFLACCKPLFLARFQWVPGNPPPFGWPVIRAWIWVMRTDSMASLAPASKLTFPRVSAKFWRFCGSAYA
jgi:hypothetical protein